MKQDFSVNAQRNLVMCFVLLFGGFLIGPAVGYLFFGVLVIVALCLVSASHQCREDLISYFRESRNIWAVALAFAIVFAAVACLSPLSSVGAAGELKWMLVWVGLILPVSLLHRSWSAMRCRRIYISAWIVAAVLAISFLDGVAQFFTHRNFARELMGNPLEFPSNRASGFLRNPIPFSHLAGSMFLISVVGLPFARAKGNGNAVWMAAVVAVAGFASVLLSQTRGAWLAVLVVAITSVFLFRGRMRRELLGGIGAAAVVGILTVAVSDSIRERLSSSFDPQQEDNRYRLEFWEANFSMLREHPWGIGYKSNQSLIVEKFEELGFEAYENMAHSHNEFIEIAVGSGWLGLALYLTLSCWLFIRVVAALRSLDQDSDIRLWSIFLLLSSAVLQVYQQVCAVTDQMSVPGRFLLCVAWAIAIVVPVDLAREKVGRPACKT